MSTTEHIDCRTVDVIDKDKRYLHLSAKDDGECYDGCCDYFKCLDCGTRWRSELPQ